MNEIILMQSLFVVGFIMFLAIIMFLFGVWHSKKEDYCKELMINNIIRTINFKKDKWGNLKGVYNNKEILIKFYLFNRYAVPENSLTIDIEASFHDASEQKFIPKSYFILKQKESFFGLKQKSNINSNNFENSFSIRNKNDLLFNNKIKQKFEFLLKNKCFNDFTVLKVQSPSESHIQDRGKVIFEKLNCKVVKDLDSLKIAMDIVVDIAKQMDEMKMGKRNNISV